MGQTRANKEELIEELVSRITTSKFMACADYRGTTVHQFEEFRRGVRESGGTASVVKNSLAKISVEKSLDGVSEEDKKKFLDLFTGPSLFVLSSEGSDPIGLAKAIGKAVKDFEPFEVKGAVFDGGFVDEAGLKQLASMPSKEELLGKLRYLLEAPASQLVRLLSAPAQQLAQALNAYQDKLK